MISVNFAKSLKFWDCRGITLLASGSSRSRTTNTRWYASRISRTSPQCVLSVTLHVRVVARRSLRASKGVFVGSLPRLRRHVPIPHVRYILDFSQPSRPSPRVTPRFSLLLRLLQRRFRSTAGAAILQLRLPHPDVGGIPSLTVPVSPSVYLTDPSLAGTPRSDASDGSSLACLHRDPH